MIDPKLFTAESVLAVVLDDHHGNNNAWRVLCEIVPEYMPPFPGKDTQPRCVVRIPACRGDSRDFVFLRGPPVATWDVYGDDFRTPAMALLAILSAPVPPSHLSREVWEAIRKAKGLDP